MSDNDFNQNDAANVPHLSVVDDPTPEENTGVVAAKTQGVPRLTVKVRPGNVVSHQDQAFDEGETLELDGPTALSLFQAGHVSIEGTVTE